MIHVGWKRVNLGDVLTLQRGFDLPERNRQNGAVPIVSSSGISGYHSIAKVRRPGVVTGRYGTLGEVFFIDKDFWPLNTTLYVRDFKGNDPLFLSYFLRTLNLAHQNVAGAVPGLNRNALHLLPVSIPPLSTQRKIAAIPLSLRRPHRKQHAAYRDTGGDGAVAVPRVVCAFPFSWA